VPGPAVPQRVGERPAQVRRPVGRVRDRAADVVGPRLPQAPLRAGPGAKSIPTGTVEIQPVGQEAVQPVLAHPVLAHPVLAQPVLAQPVLVRPVLVLQGRLVRHEVRRHG
jgi:hypothetical protein